MNVRMITVNCAAGCGTLGDAFIADMDDGVWVLAPTGWFRRETRVNQGDVAVCSRACLIRESAREGDKNESFTGRRRTT